MREENEKLENRLKIAENSARVALEENEKLRGLNLRLELKMKSQENAVRRGSTSCQKKPEDPDMKENRLSSTNGATSTDIRDVLSPGGSAKRATLHQLWGGSSET